MSEISESSFDAPVLIYIHGFLSSPQSIKAQQTVNYIEQNFPGLSVEIPEVPNYPDEAINALESIVKKYLNRPLRFIGSSMGGYLSTYLVEKYGGRAVLINPAVKPFDLLADYLGEHINPYTQKNFTLTEKHIHQLIGLNTPQVSGEGRYWALLQTGDETLDYREAEKKYASCKLTIEQGGDHSFQNYQQHLAAIFNFLFAR